MGLLPLLSPIASRHAFLAFGSSLSRLSRRHHEEAQESDFYLPSSSYGRPTRKPRPISPEHELSNPDHHPRHQPNPFAYQIRVRSTKPPLLVSMNAIRDPGVRNAGVSQSAGQMLGSYQKKGIFKKDGSKKGTTRVRGHHFAAVVRTT